MILTQSHFWVSTLLLGMKEMRLTFLPCGFQYRSEAEVMLTCLKFLPLFMNLKKNSKSFMESTWIQFSHVKWTPDNYCQPVACFSTCLLHLFLRVGIYTPTSPVLGLPLPPTRTVGLKVSNVQLRKKISLNSLLYLLSLTNISVTATCQLQVFPQILHPRQLQRQAPGGPASCMLPAIP